MGYKRRQHERRSNQEERKDSSQDMKHATFTSPTTPGAAPVILIVEDDEPIRLTLRYIIEELGYRLLEATDGREALALVYEYQPALIITDFMMPHMSGGDLIAALHAEEQYERCPIPIILLSAIGPRYTRAAGADAVLAKPFELSALEQLIQQFLSNDTPDDASEVVE